MQKDWRSNKVESSCQDHGPARLAALVYPKWYNWKVPQSDCSRGLSAVHEKQVRFLDSSAQSKLRKQNMQIPNQTEGNEQILQHFVNLP